MQTVEINEIAAAQAMSLIVGDEGRRAIENTYTVIDNCMKLSYAYGRGDEQMESRDFAAQNDDDYDAGYAEGVEDGWKVGYDAGHEAATSTEQPVPVMMPDTDVDGAVTFIPIEYSDSEYRQVPLFKALYSFLTNEAYDPSSADELALEFMRRWTMGDFEALQNVRG
jgi:hypothetical protein